MSVRVLNKRQDLFDTYCNVLREVPKLPEDIIRYGILAYLVSTPDQVINKQKMNNVLRELQFADDYCAECPDYMHDMFPSRSSFLFSAIRTFKGNFSAFYGERI